MPVSKEQVLETAALCRLDLAASAARSGEDPEAHLARLAGQLDAVIGYMDILEQVDTSGVEPLYSPLRHTAPPRADQAEKRRTADEMLANAPKLQQHFFVVPPVI